MVNDAPGSIFASGLVFQTRYRLDEPVGSGGMAQVWRGQDLVLQRPVAIKLLHPHLANDEAVMERFRREAIAAARLAHPHIVPTFDTGADHGAAYIVLGLVDGPTLASELAEHTFSALETCALGWQIADALDHAHRQDLIHRDIKPANVLLVDNKERVMVADFGIARVLSESIDPSLTLPGIVLGTPAYIAPELLHGHDIGPSVDIFALGILLHEMYCGHTVADVPTQDVKVDSKEPPSLCPKLPKPLSTVINKATRHQPSERYASAADFRDALREGEVEFRKQLPPEKEDPSSEASGPPTTAIPKIKLPAQRIITPSKQPVRDVALARVAAQRRKTITLVAIILLVTFAIAVGRFFGALSSEHHNVGATTTTTINLTSAASFDPSGSDHIENETQAKATLDSDAATTWSTETYSNRQFGNLKSGVGIAISLSSVAQLSALKVNSPSSDWSASIYAASQPSTSLSGWGHPVTGSTHISPGTTTFRLDGIQGSQVMIWITDLGTAYKVTIADISIETR